ncbi:MAG: cation diffusion facilitator family transporter [Thermodesulfobacteriota bacterium]
MSATDTSPACMLDHGHSHKHDHHHHPVQDVVSARTGGRLLITLGLNLAIPVAQIIGGYVAHSYALLSDATHNFSDFTAILISYVAFRIAQKGPSLQNTFGYRRAEILAAMVNVALLVGASIAILIGAFNRLRHPEPVEGILVIAVAAVGVLGNGFSAWLLHHDSQHNVNVRGAFLHMVGDMLTSVLVVINGVILMFRPWYWIDPLLSVLIVGFILKNCWGILREAAGILMNATPGHIDLREVIEFFKGFHGVEGAHYLHAWNLGSSGVAFSAHVVVPDQPVSRLEGLRQEISDGLMRRFGIDHPVLQFETAACGNGGMFCEQLCAAQSGETGDEGTAKSLSETPPVNACYETTKFSWVSWLFRLLRIGLGIVWIWASIDKLMHPGGFAEIVYNYRLLPDMAVNAVAIVLPSFEILLGLFLVIGVWVPGAAFGSLFLMSVFLMAIGYNLYRGLDIHCGCFSTSASEGPISLWEIGRDGVLWLVSILLLIREQWKRG